MNNTLTAKESKQFEDLCSLVSGLARSTDITLQLGSGWAWNDQQRIVYVPKEDLNDLERCKAIAAHEVGHILFTRRVHTLYQADDIYKPNIHNSSDEGNNISFPNKKSMPSSLIHYLFNALEDPRIENGIGQIYPGVHTWLWNLHHRENLESEEMLTHMRKNLDNEAIKTMSPRKSTEKDVIEHVAAEVELGKLEQENRNKEKINENDQLEVKVDENRASVWDPIPSHFGPFSSSTPLPMMFCHANIYEYHNSWQPVDFEKELPEIVVQALQETREIRKVIYNMLPQSENLLTFIGEQEKNEIHGHTHQTNVCKLAYEKVNPRLYGEKDKSKRNQKWVDKKEARIYLAVVFVWELIEKHILPWLERLYQFDLRRIQYHIDKFSDRTIKKVLQRGDVQLIVSKTFGTHISAHQKLPTQVKVESSLARQVLDEYYQQKCRKAMEHRVEQVSEQLTCAKGSQIKTKYRQHIKNNNTRPQYGNRDGQTQKLRKEYSEMKKKIAPYIRRLSEDLSDCLRPRKQFGWQGGYTSGTKVDLKKMLQAQARNQGEINFWKRRRKLDRRSAAATLLIDLSGSMQGEKSIAAIQGAILFVEALIPLQVPISVKGFQRDVIDVIQFGEPLTISKRCDIAKMLSQVGSVNNDSLAVETSAKELLEMKVEDRLLIVISDGEPVGRNAGTLLEKAVQTASEKIHVVGLGIGSNTRHVERYYPNGKGNIPVEKIGREIAIVLQKVFRKNRYIN